MDAAEAQLVNMILRNLTETQDAIKQLDTAIAGALGTDFESCEIGQLVVFTDLSSTLVKIARQSFESLVLVPLTISLCAHSATSEDA